MSRPSIFITGAAAGIGRATAKRFAAAGWFIGLYDVNEPGVRELARELGPERCASGRLDVTDPAAFATALAQFWEAAGRRLDVLFNNAGIGSSGNFEDLPLARYEAIVNVNLKGVVNGTYAAFRYLRQTPRARVISMCSASALYGAPAFAVYSATKFGVRGLTEALDIEWRRHGVRVMDVLPLYVDTAMVANFENRPRSLDALGLRLTPDDIAATVWRAANWHGWWPRIHWYPGFQSWSLALLTRLLPAWLNRFTTRLITRY